MINTAINSKWTYVSTVWSSDNSAAAYWNLFQYFKVKKSHFAACAPVAFVGICRYFYFKNVSLRFYCKNLKFYCSSMLPLINNSYSIQKEISKEDCNRCSTEASSYSFTYFTTPTQIMGLNKHATYNFSFLIYYYGFWTLPFITKW